MCNTALIYVLPILSSVLLWFGITGLNNKRVYIRGGRYIERDESPVNYWLNVGTYLCAGIGGLGFSLIAWCLR